MASEDKDSGEYNRFGGQLVRQSMSARLFSMPSLDANRVVYVDNQLLPSDDLVILPVYPNNTVVSSKYTIFTFLPKNLFEQFRRIANFYFLCVACIQFVIDTPVTPMTSILPLSFVIVVTAIKQGYEDWLRHKADSEVNLRQAVIIRNGKEMSVRWMDINVGDIVKVKRNEDFPCDLIMLSSEDPLGQCFVTTANLDGETNLKTFYSLSDTRTFNTPEELGYLRARITCKPQVPDLYSFQGIVDLGADSEPRSLGPENLLLRGARLKNTAFVYGCAVYTGKDTKMVLNSKSKQIKFSRVERKMNTFLLVFLAVLLLECALSAGFRYLYDEENGVPWYIPGTKTSKKPLKVIEHFLAFMVLYNYVIPISLYVTVEVQKFLGSLFFGMDIEMYDPAIDERAKANTSDLNEELGQVEYLFADKTGTLTENAMLFRKCFIGIRQFEVVEGIFCEKFISESVKLRYCVEFTKEMDEFFKVLVLCHTVRIDHHHQLLGPHGVHSATCLQYDYQASSPDEKALVKASCRYGIIYHGIIDNVLEVTFHGKLKRFKLLHTLPFDANRKRMSVIVQEENGVYLLLCKGAEIAIFDRVVNEDISFAQNLVNEYAMRGLRTLAIAHRKLSPEEYRKCDGLLTTARLSLTRREEMISFLDLNLVVSVEKINSSKSYCTFSIPPTQVGQEVNGEVKLAEAYDEIERDMTLLGATAVEDKLQDQVPQTIEALRMAGIKVWVLTGDKEETAVNISHAAGHFNSNMHELRLTHVAAADHCEPQLQELLSQTRESDDTVEYALIIDSQSLAYAMKSHTEMLRLLCSRCVAVLCCRMSPLQKAEVVAMIKNSPDKPVTAAIGDGANDVSMIQEAHVGFGIMGKEGRQAVRNSDYAFGKFKFVRRALLLHGHLYYHRTAVLVQYFFYKNVAWITGQVFYSFFCSFSEQSLFDPFFLMFYNLTFTSLPILIYGLFEQHLSKDELLEEPELYRKISRNATLSWSRFLRWNFLGLWHCVVTFFGIFLLEKDGVSMFESGKTIGNSDFGAIILYTCVVNVNIKLLLETYYWCIPTLISYTFTFVGLVVLSVFYTNIFFPSWIVNHQDMYKALGQIYSTPVTWLAMLVLIVLALIPDILIRIYRDNSRQRHKLVRAGTKSAMLQQQNSGLPSSSTTLTGYDNLVISLSDETPLSATSANGFNRQMVPEEASGSLDSSQKAGKVAENLSRNSETSAVAVNSGSEYANGNGLATRTLTTFSTSSPHHERALSASATAKIQFSENELQPPCDSNEIFGVAQDTATHTVLTDHAGDQHTCSPPESDHTGDQRTYSPPESGHTGDQCTCSPPESDHTGDQRTCSSPESDHKGDQRACSPPESGHAGDQRTCSPPGTTDDGRIGTPTQTVYESDIHFINTSIQPVDINHTYAPLQSVSIDYMNASTQPVDINYADSSNQPVSFRNLISSPSEQSDFLAFSPSPSHTLPDHRPSVTSVDSVNNSEKTWMSSSYHL